MREITITRAGAERADDVEDVCRSLFEAVADAGPAVPGIPVRDLDETWERRRANYLEWLAEPGAFLLIAEAEGRVVGYAMVRTEGPLDGWDSHGPLAELESLAVLPGLRGRGIGRLLVEAAEEQLRAAGISSLLIGTVAGNRAAIGFYQHLGYPLWANQYLGRIPDGPR